MSASKEDEQGAIAGCFCIIAVIVIVLVLGAVRLAGGIMPNYGEGTRVGVLYKLAYKGWIWKSWEGEIGVGVDQHVFQFSTLDPELAKEVERLEGRRVKVHYRQYLFAPIQQSTSYNVVSIEPFEDEK